ncbi:MAG: hypothetical protein O2971_12585 [Proteobacteria bacterium]|nr:hypothetical protein [Pseudomonadota bacterium]
MMKPVFYTRFSPLLLILLSVSTLYIPSTLHADFADLIDAAVLVETNPEPEPLDQGEEPVAPGTIGAATNASYVSSGGWAVTGEKFIDAATFVFDFFETSSVSQATLTLPIQTVYMQNGSAPVELTFFSDNGKIEYTDYSIGFATPLLAIDAAGLTVIQADVTGAVNSALSTGRYVGFRIKSTVSPGSVDTSQIPAYVGVRLITDTAQLQFTPGAPPEVAKDTTRFDGFTLEVPIIEVPTLGEVAAQFRLVDPNKLRFQLTFAAVTGGTPGPPPLSGSQLFDCASFTPPVATDVAAGVATYSITSGILDVPSVNLNNEQIALRMEYIEGTDPWIFETLSLGAVQSGPSDALISALGGGLIVEPSQDFVPLCHGWVLVGDLIRNRVVERNLISGETGATYSFNTAPNQFTLDEANNSLYMTVHPESERLYKLDLLTGAISHNFISQELFGDMGASYVYSFALRDLALGENGNIFAIMFDGAGFDPENGIPHSDTQLWLGLMTGNGVFLINSLPLEEPIRVEYDPVLDHLFLANATNLATFNFNVGTNALSIVQGTDIPVGSNCTDFDISPDGTRLAYTCPTGNYGDGDFAIADMDPENYYNNDGEWFLNSEPVSATFSADGTLFIATDNQKLYFFDVKTHLILEDFELGLLEGETIRKIRISRDGDLLYVFLNNDVHSENSKFYWMPMPAIMGTPL